MTPYKVYFDARPYSLDQRKRILDLAKEKEYRVFKRLYKEYPDGDSKLTHIGFSTIHTIAKWTDDNGEWFDKYGYTKLNTWEEIIDWLNNVTVKPSDVPVGPTINVNGEFRTLEYIEAAVEFAEQHEEFFRNTPPKNAQRWVAAANAWTKIYREQGKSE
jgi:hypothetical protein